MVFPSLEIIAEEQIEHLLRQGHILGHDLDEPPCGGVHRRHPHHLRVVLTETLGAVDRDLLALERFQNFRLLALGIGKPCLILAADLIERRFRDIDIALLDERGAEAVDHRQDQRADLVAVDVGIGADHDLVPAEVLKVERAEVLGLFRLHLDAAAEDADEVGDDLGLEDAVIIRFQAV